MASSERIWEFIAALFTKGQPVYGALIAVSLWCLDRWALKRKKRIPWQVYGTIIVISFFVSAYQEWGEKYNALTEEIGEANALRAKLDARNPKFVVGYYEAYCAKDNPMLAVLAYIGNQGQSPSIAHDFKVIFKGARQRVPFLHPFEFLFHLQLPAYPGSVEQKDMLFSATEFIQNRAMITPINPGQLVRGWLVSGVEPWERCDDFDGASIVFKDVLDRQYSISVNKLQIIPPLPDMRDFVGYPDITYPFKPRVQIEGIKRKLHSRSN